MATRDPDRARRLAEHFANLQAVSDPFKLADITVAATKRIKKTDRERKQQ